MDEAQLEEWVERSRSGDLAAYDALVRRYYRVIFGLAFRMLEHREGAEDAAQEIFVKAWRNLHRFRHASRFSTWLHSIAVRHCLSLVKQRRSETARRPAMTEPNTRGGVEDAFPSGFDMERWVQAQIVREAILKLPEKLRLVVVLYYYSDYTVKEIAEALGLPPRTIYSRLEKGKSRLGNDLKGMGR